MGEFCKCKDVSVIQGDVLEVYFELIGIEPEVVQNLWFSSKRAGLYTSCPFSKIHNAYCLRLESECTERIKPCICNYDLTVEFIDGNKMTVVHERLFAVLKKRNELEEA